MLPTTSFVPEAERPSYARAKKPAAPLLVPLFAVIVAGCVTAPGNGGEVSTTRAPVTFAGVGLAAARTITVEAASSARGPFTAIRGATTTTSARATQTMLLSGGVTVPLYGFSLAAVIPAVRWHAVSSAGCALSETFVRVRDGGLSYLTFDTDTVGLSCIQKQLASGDALNVAIAACRSLQSPVLRLIQGTSSHVGDVVIDDAADLAALACVRTIEGSLTVTSSAPYLVSLPQLEQVTGDVQLTYTSYAPDPHPPSSAYEAIRCGATHFVTAEVRVFDLPSFSEVGGDLTLHQEGTFSGSASTQPIDLGLNALDEVAGDVSITIDQFGGSPCGLGALGALPGDLLVDFNNGGEVGSVVSGLMASLSEVEGTVTFAGGHNAFGNPLPSLTRAGGLHVIKNPTLTGFHFPALSEVTGTVELDGTGPGSNPSGLTLVGNLVVHDSGFTSLESIGGPTLTLGGLDLHDNPALSALSSGGASKVTLTSSAPLTLTGNAALSSSQVCSFVALQSSAGWGGSSNLGGVSCP